MSDLTPETLEFDPGRISIMSGWLVYDVGYHTCGGYGPESGYAHEPGCGAEPMCEVTDIPDILAAAAERDALAESVRAYGRTIDRWGLLIIAATHSEDITTPDGDGDWEVIESRLAEVPALLAERDALAAKVERVRALHGPRVLQVLGATCFAEECDHEDACPLVDYTVCGHCYDVGDGAHPYAYEEGGLQDVAHPCATRRALDFTEATA